MDSVPKKEHYAGKHWTFTPDGKQFFTLGLFSENLHHRQLIDAYQRHPKRRAADVNVEFVFRDETSKGQKIVKRHSMSDIVAQLESSPEPAVPIAPYYIKAVQQNLERLRTDGDARREMAANLIRESAWWDTHVHGPVRSPNDCEHLRIGRYGLELYSGNRFLVEMAILECTSFIGGLVDVRAASESPSRFPAGMASLFRSLLREKVHGCVANIYDEIYSSYGESDLMRFGGHSINVKEFVDGWFRLCELDGVFS